MVTSTDRAMVMGWGSVKIDLAVDTLEFITATDASQMVGLEELYNLIFSRYSSVRKLLCE